MTSAASSFDRKHLVTACRWMIRQWGWPPVKDAPKLAANQSGAGESGRWFTRMASQNEAAWAGRARHEEETWRYCEPILTGGFYRYVLPQPSGPSIRLLFCGLTDSRMSRGTDVDCLTRATNVLCDESLLSDKSCCVVTVLRRYLSHHIVTCPRLPPNVGKAEEGERRAIRLRMGRPS